MPRSPIAPPATALTDGVVSVRMRKTSDLVHIAASADDPDAARWLDIPPASAPPNTPEQILELWRGGSTAPLIIADLATDEAAGLINLQFRAADDTSVAYRIFPRWRGRGFAARALELLTVWALEERHLPSLVLEIEEANVASIRVAERCGYVPTGQTAGEPPKIVFARSDRPAR